MKPATLEKRVGEITAKDGLQCGHQYLLRLREDLKVQMVTVQELITALENEAVEQRLGILVPGQRRELAPSKETFIATFGIETWNRMKRMSNASPRFVWKDDCEM